MKVTPLDIRKQTFKKVLRGVDLEEVRMFLELVASEYEKVVQDNAMMAEKLSYQEERLDEYRELEKSLRNSLVTAERITAESREASDREAERIIGDAQKRAERILEDSRERLQRLVQEVENLRNKKEVYVRRFRTMIESQLGVLQEHEQQFDEIETLEVSARDLLVRSERNEETGYSRRQAEIVSIRSARDANGSRDDDSERRASSSSRIAEARALAARNTRPTRVTDEMDDAEGDGYDDDEPARAHERPTETNGAPRRAETTQEEDDDEPFLDVRQRREGFFEFQADAAGEKSAFPTRRAGY
ncbi:MAG: DivIVA domain-containing protein [Candidatus Eisenbacteria bacterium]|uniref:DivIVA domain-containing protein n=1 Tax=Eiseniibacteriota bacterium TaxID=2212470 RepID=A0A956LVT1_UNCEI|nr:DivIVA domain-containing protein [Candidatus Eisenbacteria bacterium]